jgi:regulator of protease activity HflC (stomatin/prohibitin superfamily)
MKKKTLLILGVVCLLLSSSCAIIIQDEVGVKRTFGKLSKKTLAPGLRTYNPFASTIIRVPIRTVNLKIDIGLPSKEGLTVKSEISILYKLKTKEIPEILTNIGLDYQNVLILPVFRSASADVCARFNAKDMHSSKRAMIEKEIRDRMMEVLEDRGFIIEAVLMKSITLPSGLSRAIEMKLQAEQEAQQMEFLKQREQRDAERLVIEAEGKKKVAKILAEGEKQAKIIAAEGDKTATELRAEGTAKANELTNKNISPLLLKFLSIEAFKELAKSQNAKVIITDGKTPFLSLPDVK